MRAAGDADPEEMEDLSNDLEEVVQKEMEPH